MRYVLAVLLCLSCATVLADEPPKARPGAGPAAKLSPFPHIRVDVLKRQVAFDAKVCLREGILEFLVCSGDAKQHESVLTTQAKPSHVHAALLMFGLMPGKPARRCCDRPEASTLPPQGPELKITARWKDAGGKPHEVPAQQFLKVGEGRKAKVPEKWVFIGSDMLPEGGYWADGDGELICVANFSSAVIDVPFSSTAKQGFEEFMANPKVVPPKNTKVEVVITVPVDAAKSPHVRATLDVDPKGRIRTDTGRIARRELRNWSSNLAKKHEGAMVVLRISPLARAHDITLAKDQIRLGGIWDVEIRYMPTQAPIVPRTDVQSKEDMAAWAEKFKNALDYFPEPGKEARAVLKYLDAYIDQMKAEQKIAESYRAALAESLKAYKVPKGHIDGPDAGE
jgi:hypothetical protein